MSRPPRIIEPIQASFGEALAAIADEQKPEVESTSTKPFLKWVGGKRSILNELTARMPAHYNTYREPFIGGGALFFRVQPARAALSDINFHLMLIWPYVRLVQQSVELPQRVLERELVECVYRSESGHYDHVLVPTGRHNVFLTIVVDRVHRLIFGHRILDLNALYGLDESGFPK
jgi:site-specific DNA-adenine methylase